MKIECDKFVIRLIRNRVNVSQFAYVPGAGKGTVVALTLMYFQLLRYLDKKSGVVRVTAVDLPKAFDS